MLIYFLTELCQKLDQQKKRYERFKSIFKLDSSGEKYLGVEWLPLASKQYAKYFESVPKGKKKKTSREFIMTADIVTTAFNTASAAKQTVDNILGNMVKSKQIRRPKKRIYALTPKDIQ